MTKIRKVMGKIISTLTILILVCQNVAFGLTERTFVLRPLLYFDKSKRIIIENTDWPETIVPGIIVKSKGGRKFVVCGISKWGVVVLLPIFNTLNGETNYYYSLKDAKSSFKFVRGRYAIGVKATKETSLPEEFDNLIGQLRDTVLYIESIIKNNAYDNAAIEKELNRVESEVVYLLYKLGTLAFKFKLSPENYANYIDVLLSVKLIFPATISYGQPYMPYEGPCETASLFLQQGVSSLLIWEKLNIRIESLSDIAKKLQLGMCVVSKSFNNLNELFSLQKTVGNSELGLSIIHPIQAGYPIIIIYKNIPCSSPDRFINWTLHFGHSHCFDIPIDPTRDDHTFARHSGNRRSPFILAFGNDGHVELALWDASTKDFIIEHKNQRWIVERLHKIGLLAKPMTKKNLDAALRRNL